MAPLAATVWLSPPVPEPRPSPDVPARRRRLILAPLALLALYAMAGFLGLPHLARTYWLPELERSSGLRLAAERLRFDPFRLDLELRHLTVRDAAGDAPFILGDAHLDLEALDTLRRGRPVMSLSVENPVVTLRRDEQGRLSLAGFPLSGSGNPAPGLPVGLGRLAVRGGSLVFEDLANNRRTTARYDDITLTLADGAGHAGRGDAFALTALGPDGERLAVTGTLTRNPLRLDGRLETDHLNLAGWSGLLPEALGWQLLGGRAELRGDFAWSAAGSQPGLKLTLSQASLAGLAAVQGQAENRRIAIERLDSGPFDWDGPARRMCLAWLSLTGATTPWGRLDRLRAENLLAGTGGGDAALASIELEQLHLASAQVMALKAGPLAYAGETRALTLEAVDIAALKAPGLAAKGLRIAGLQGSLAEGARLSGLRAGSLQADSAEFRSGRVRQLAADAIGYQTNPGRLGIGNLSAAQLDSPWGSLTSPRLEALDYRLAERALQTGPLVAAAAEGAWGHAGTLRVDPVELDPGLTRLTTPRLEVRALATRWGRVDILALEQLGVDLAGRSASAGRLIGQDITAAPGRLALLTGSQLRLDGAGRRLTLADASARDIRTEDVQAAGLTVSTLELDLAGQRFRLQAAELTDALALGRIEAEAASPPPAQSEPLPAGAGATADAAANPYQPRRARLGQLRLEDIRGGLRPRELAIRRIVTDKTALDVIRRDPQTLEIRGLPAFGRGSLGPAGPAWRFAIDEFQLGDSSIHAFDETTEPPVRLRFNGLTLKAYDLTTERDNATEFRLRTQIGSSSRFEAEGRAQFRPLQLNFRFGLDKLRLRSIEPYWKPLTNVDLQRGNLSLWGDVVVREDPGLHLDYAGGAEVLEVDAVERGNRQSVLKWDLLKVDGLAISNRPSRFVARVLTAEKPYARVAVDEHGQLNLLEALEPPSQAAIPAGLEALQVERTPANQLPSASIGLLRIKDGVVNFSDRSMKPGFIAEVRKFDGTITGLSSRADAKASLSLEGRLNGNAPVRVFGELDPMEYRDHTDITAQFKGLNLTNFSAYSGQFGGYRVERGKLDMDLRYRLRAGQVEIENRVILDKLTLGERVGDNGSWLVDFAIQLLKSGDGKIDVNLPVYGDLSNPQFSLWALYRDVFANLIAQVYFTPMLLVDEVIGREAAAHYTVAFPPGRIELTDTGAAALTEVARAMALRLGASLDIEGSADPRHDRLALAGRALREQLITARRAELRAQGVRLRSDAVPELTDTDYRRLFTTYYREKHPFAAELRELEDRRQTTLDGPLFDAAQRKVLGEWPVDETTLRALAMARAESIRGYLIEEEGVPDERLFLREVRLAIAADEQVRAALTLESF
ncbi:hypothetical protein JCM19379_22260 [Methyloparacoccus murrellii]